MCKFNCKSCKKGQPHYCKHCGKLDVHFSSNCPKKKKKKSSHGIFINRSFKKGKIKEPCILLIREKRGKYAGQLNMPGGQIDRVYGSRNTLEKEADEEFGVSLGNMVRRARSPKHLKLNNDKTNLYLIELPKGFSRIGYNPTQYPSETSGAAWVPVSYLKTGHNVWANTDGIIDTVSSFTLKVVKLMSRKGWI